MHSWTKSFSLTSMQEELMAMVRGNTKLDQNQLQQKSPEVANKVTEAFQSIVDAVTPLGDQFRELIPKIPSLGCLSEINTIIPSGMAQTFHQIISGFFTLGSNGFPPSQYIGNTLEAFGHIFSAVLQDIMASPGQFSKLFTQFAIRHMAPGPVASLF